MHVLSRFPVTFVLSRSFFQYVSLQEPARADQCRPILAIPNKRYERRLIKHLKLEEIDALLAAPDRATWIGRRDRALLLVAIQTGLRVSELVGLRRDDVFLGTGPHVRCEAKGRKERCTPAPPGSGRSPYTMVPRVSLRAGGTGFL